MTTDRYRIPYEVPAANAITALMTAGQMLRSGVAVVRIVSNEPIAPGWYRVDLLVEEDTDPPEPLWLHEDPAFVDHDADATPVSEWSRP